MGSRCEEVGPYLVESFSGVFINRRAHFQQAYYRSSSSVVEDEMLWSFSLFHGLRLSMPLRFVIARRVATRNLEAQPSATSMLRPAQQ